MHPSHAAPRSWQALGVAEPRSLGDAWRQLHWAAQPLAAWAAAALEARPDDSHLNLGWDPATGALVSHPAGSRRAGLRLADLTLLWLEGPSVTDEYRLGGRRLEEGLDWLRAAANRARPEPGTPLGEMALPGWDMPAHPVGEGRPFDASPATHFEEVARWYANLDRAFAELAAATPGASPVRCWPHHFDHATLVTLGESAEGETTSIGVGLAPADDSLEEPYVYANPWPRPEAAAPPTLESGGEWHREGWFGAVLRATRLLEGEAAGQPERLDVFLRSALAAGRRLLGEED